MKIDDFLDSPQPNKNKRAGAVRIDDFLGDAPAATFTEAPIIDPLTGVQFAGASAPTEKRIRLPGSVFDGMTDAQVNAISPKPSGPPRSVVRLPPAQPPIDTSSIGPVQGPQADAASIIRGLLSSAETGARKARAGVRQAVGDLVGSDYLKDQAQREFRQADLTDAITTPEFESDTARGIYGGGASLVRQLPAFVVGALTRNPSIMTAGVAGPIVPEKYAEYRGRGASPLVAAPAAIGQGATEYITERLPMGFLVNQFGKVGASQFLTGLLAREVPSEQLATLVQDAIDTATANPDKTWGDYLRERPSAAYQTLLATLTQTGLMSAGNSVVNRLRAPTQTPAVPPQLVPQPVPAPAAAPATIPTPAPAPAAAPTRIEPFLGEQAGPANPIAALSQMIRDTATQTSPLQTTSAAELPAQEMPAEPAIVEAAPAEQPQAALPEEAPPAAPSIDEFLDAPTQAAPAELDQADVAAAIDALDRQDSGAELAQAVAALKPDSAQTTQDTNKLPIAPPEPAAQTAAAPTTTMQKAEAVVPGALQAPAKLDGTQAQQIIDPQPGMRPGDIVNARGLPFTNKANAQRVAKDAGPGWRVARSNKGFVVRWQPASDKQIANAKALAKRGAQVDMERDSMLAAIAKLGGMSREQLISEWGADPADLKSLRGAGIYRVATAGGRPLDSMGEALAELGYLSQDQNGKHDMREFEELFFNELAGAKHYTPLGYQRQAEAQREAEYENFLNSNDAQAAGENGLPEQAQDAINEELAADAVQLEDYYDRLEREAIQWEAELAGQQQADDDIPGFDTKPVRSAMGGSDERDQPFWQGEGGSNTRADQASEDSRPAQSGIREEGARSQGPSKGDGQRVEQPKRPYDQKGQLDLFLSNGPDPSQAGPSGEAAQREAVAALDDLHTTGTVLGQALSSDYAARQRISLVGRKVTSPEDLAVLAQVYRDPRFETFRVIFTNSKGDIVSQVGLTSRLPGSSAAIVGDDLNTYLSELAATAKNRGAARYYLLHNHPSGIATPSEADSKVTRTFAQRMPDLEFLSHVVIDTNEYADINANGEWTLNKKDFGQVDPITKGEWAGTKVKGPETLMEIAKGIDSDLDAVTLVVTDQQLRVKRLTTIPRSALTDDKTANRRTVLRAAMRAQGAQVFAIGRDQAALQALDGIVVDSIHINNDGAVSSLLASGKVEHGKVYPDDRRTRVSPDTSKEFDYLRARSLPNKSDTKVASESKVVRQESAPYDTLPDGKQEEIELLNRGRSFDPISVGDFFKLEKSKSGRKEYAAGRKLYQRLSTYSKDYLGKLKLADNKPDVFKAMMRQLRVDQMKAGESAKRIAEAGQNLTPEQRVMLSDLIEKQAKVGDVPPQEIAELAATMTAALDVQARELVELGMLSEERLVKNYLPRLYRNGLSATLTNPTLLRGWFTKAMMRVKGARLQSRGMYADLPVENVELAKKLGWKVASMTDGAEIPKDLFEAFDTSQPVPPNYQGAKVRMWRDYTEAERQEMGEIRDAVLRYAMGYVETQKDVAIGRLFKAIAMNGDLAKTFNPGGWVKVPETQVQGVPGVKAYGALAGMYVEPQVADALKRNTQPKGLLMASYDKALNFWKEGKTVWNPVSHGNNVVSNLFTAYFAGVNPASPERWRETIREFRTKGRYWNEAVDNGLFGTEFANTEIQNLLMPDLDDMADLESVAASRVTKMVEFAKRYPGRPISWYRERMQRAYEFEDQFFKLMLYIDRRKAGMEPQQAINDTERYVFNYADVPEGVELIKRTYSPFFAYTYKAIPMVMHTAMTRPDRMLAPVALLGGANWLAYAILGADEEKERKGMPEYLQGRTMIGTQKAVRMPFNVEGRPSFMDMSRRVPLGDLFDMNNQTNGLPVPAPFMPSHPVLSIMQAVLYNQDTFTGKDLVKKSDTAWEAAQARGGYLYRQFAPNAPFIPGSYNFNKLADATAYTFDTEIGPYTGRTKAGDPIPMSTTLPDVLTGTKIRSFDPERGVEYQGAGIGKEEKEVRANIRSANRNQSLTENARARYVADQQRKLEELRQKREELRQ